MIIIILFIFHPFFPYLDSLVRMQSFMSRHIILRLFCFRSLLCEHIFLISILFAFRKNNEQRRQEMATFHSFQFTGLRNVCRFDGLIEYSLTWICGNFTLIYSPDRSISICNVQFLYIFIVFSHNWIHWLAKCTDRCINGRLEKNKRMVLHPQS